MHLNQALRSPLTVVNGAAGAGKTLLTADWAAGLRVPTAWLTVETGDHPPGVFWAYVFESLRVCGARAGDTPARQRTRAVWDRGCWRLSPPS